jgi:hypothetical protein
MSNPIEHKLFHYEVEPLAKNWDAISHALDDQLIPHPDRLYHFEQVPSAEIWTAMQPELDAITTIQPATVIPFYKRNSQGLKYVAAASVLVIIAIAIALLLNKDAVSNEVALQPSIEEPKKNVVIADPKGSQLPDKKQEIPSSPRAQFAGRYVKMADDEGKRVRLSKKAYNVFNCAENTAAINYERCKENIQTMQQKMSASVLSPTGDFAGLIEMIRTLEENK